MAMINGNGNNGRTSIVQESIPFDILIAIFRLCLPQRTQVCTKGYLEETPESKVKMWLVVTQVCRDWRMKALDCPLLWSTPDFFVPALAQGMIARSTSVPLHIHFHLDWLHSSTAAAVFADALNHAAGIEALHVQTEYTITPGLNSVLLMLANPAPCLRSLEVRLASGSGSFFLPRPLLANSASQLRSITFSNCIVPWSSVLLQNLTTLVIIRGFQPGLTLGTVLKALSTMPTLEDLMLWNCLPAMPETLLNSILIHFPQMRRIRICCRLLTCAALLKRISFPDSTKLIVHGICTNACMEAQAPVAFNSWFSSLFQGAFRQKRIGYLAIGDAYKGMPNLQLQAWSDVDEHATQDILSALKAHPYQRCRCKLLTPTPFLSMNLDWELTGVDMNSIDMSPVAFDIIRALPLQELETLQLETLHFPLFTSQIITVSFNKCKRLQTIAIEGQAGANSFIDSLHENAQDDFSALQRLHFHRVSDFHLPPLLRYLEQRFERIGRLQNVVFKDCNLADANSNVDQIRQYVEDFEWA